MNTAQILKQAWQNVLHYRTLWLFAIILALTTFSWGTAAYSLVPNGEDNPPGITVTPRAGEPWLDAFRRAFREEIAQANQDLDEFFAQELDIDLGSDFVAILTWIVSISAVLYVAGKVARYLSETALIRMVDAEGKQTIRQGFRLAWSRAAWQLFFIELLINLLAAAAGILLFALIFSPLPWWIKGSETTVLIGAILTGGLFFLAIFLIILFGMGISLLKFLSRRACALEHLNVTASVYRGYTLLWGNLKALLPVGLVTLGVNLAWPALIGVLLLLLFGLGVLLGGLPALLISNMGLASAGQGLVFVVIAIGAIILILILATPLVWLDGMRQVFLSSIWTLTFRELGRLEKAGESLPDPSVLPKPLAPPDPLAPPA